MDAIIEFKKIINDNSLIMAIIAINMTIIGLTSLAETKRIIGVDYGSFLLKKYKLLNLVRIYVLLVVFAIVNVGSLFFMFVKVTEFRVVNFMVLTLSLVFAIFYFFAYIIVENRNVRKQIYEQELLGLYYDSDEVTTFEVDRLVELNNGSRTPKKLSGNIITYFNTFNSDTQRDFVEIFGPESMLYDHSSKLKKKIWRLYSHNPYRYRVSPTGIYDISFEFFQLFRHTELQDKWTIDVLRLFNGYREADEPYDLFRLYNFSRMIAQLNVFGTNTSIYKYKFLEYLIGYYYSAVRMTDEDRLDMSDFTKVLEIERFTVRQLFDFIFRAAGNPKDNDITRVSIYIINDIVLHKKYAGLLAKEELIKIYLDKTLEYNVDVMKQGFAKC
ncbi:hypothetical protein V7182_17725 [Neobacillus drentensis]|uniref:hypothetical protein n=1 Tax=Neobacillus drentensis TaxID=220684 RepID=UPI002FFE39C7